MVSRRVEDSPQPTEVKLDPSVEEHVECVSKPRDIVIGMIWAQARDTSGRAVIGAKGGIPWHLPEDFEFFKTVTAGHPIIMGERTWVSLPKKPLPNRTNIVLTQEPSDDQRATFAKSLPEAFEVAAKAPGGELAWVIGGESIYRQAMEYADLLEVTEIDLEVDGDTFAPEISPDEFVVPDTGIPWRTAANGLRYRHVAYQRR